MGEGIQHSHRSPGRGVGRWGQDLSLVLTGGSESVMDTQGQLERGQGGG